MRVYDPPHVALKQLILDGEIGRPLLFRGIHRMVLLRKSGEHLLKQEVFYGARNQVYDGVQARGGVVSQDVV